MLGSWLLAMNYHEFGAKCLIQVRWVTARGPMVTIDKYPGLPAYYTLMGVSLLMNKPVHPPHSQQLEISIREQPTPTGIALI